jgi:chlorophyll synthase/bacteriochlorophyll c synthase
VAYLTINGFEAMLLVLALIWRQYWVATFMLLALIAPIYNQIKLYQEPTQQNYVRYLLASNPFVALIQIISGLLVGGYFG